MAEGNRDRKGNMNLLTVENLDFSYQSYEEETTFFPILQNVSFSLEEGEFAVLCGANGCGKSTLLKMLKREVTPAGKQSGRILFCDRDLEGLSERESACAIGYVAQNPEHANVCDKVWHEMAFGLESMGVPTKEMRRRVAEMAAFFGIDQWMDFPVSALSGGQKQILALACVLLMQPRLLLLDEPSAQLDPIATNEFFRTLLKCNEELGITILIVEHRLDELLPMADKLLVMDQGSVRYSGSLQDAKIPKELYSAMPCGWQLAHAFQKTDIPITIRESRRWLKKHFAKKIETTVSKSGQRMPNERANHKLIQSAKIQKLSEKTVYQVSNVFFSYDGRKDVLKGFSIRLSEGKIYCLLGGNGSGKSTALRYMAGILGNSGRNRKQNTEKIAYLPQDVETCFLYETVEEELGNAKQILPFDFEPYKKKHPYDLSGGEKQIVAFEKVLRYGGNLLLLDEPAKGLDACYREQLVLFMKFLKEQGKTILFVSHDVELAAMVADEIGLFSDGEVVAWGNRWEFFHKNAFYTTQAIRVSKGILKGFAVESESHTEKLPVTTQELIDFLKKEERGMELSWNK